MVNFVVFVICATHTRRNYLKSFSQHYWLVIEVRICKVHFTPLTFLTAQKMKFSVKGFFSKYDQMRGLLRI